MSAVPGPDDYKKWMVAAAPVLTYGPTSGFGLGLAGNMAVYQGLPHTTRISSIVASVTATTKEQVLANAKINASSRDNRRHFQSDNPQGRFRGESLVYGEAEYRFTVTKNGLFGMVAFLNTETLSSDETGEKLFDSFATGGGFGFRVILNKKSQTNLCLDIGFGKDGSRAVCLAVQEAF